MTALSALLARDRVVPPHKLDEAIQRQVINGGDFETNLLEVGAIGEETLTAYCAAAYEHEPVAPDAFATATPEARARLTKEEVLRLHVIPLSIESGALLVAAAEPPTEAARDEIEHLSGLRAEVRITTPFRLACVMTSAYGQPLSPRFERLAKRLVSHPSGSTPVVRPSTPPARNLESDPAGVARIRPSVLAALSAAVIEDREHPSPDTYEQDAAAAADPHWTESALETFDDAATVSPVESLRQGPVLVTAGYEAAPADDAESIEPLPAHGPLTLEQARDVIARSTTRDEIVGTLLDFAHLSFTFAALFVVHGDVAEGLDARGEGVPGESMRQLAVPLDTVGAFRSVKERGKPAIGPMTTVRTDTLIQADLGRDGVPTVALLPVHIGGRVALILWADPGRGSLDLAKVDALASVCVEAARAFERLIVERKRRRSVADAANNAAVAIAAMDLSKVTTADISRRFAEQRGQQALRALSNATASAPVPEDQRATQELGRPVPADASVAVSVRNRLPREEPDEPHVPHASTTQFARGGRIPIAVDVIGPLPGAMPVNEVRAPARAPRGYDPRREPEETEPVDEPPTDDPARLIADVVRTGELADATAHVLLTAGERALAPLFRSFPGPTTIERTNTRTRIPPASEVGPLLRLAVMFRNVAAPSLVQQLESNDPDRRFFATLCLTELVVPAAVQPLFARLFDTDFPTSAVAVEALRAYRRVPDYEGVLRALRGIVPDVNEASDRRRIAANVLGELRDAAGVPALIAALDDRDGALSGISRRSLVVLTRQDFGQDASQWDAWWRRAQDHHRVEWLIDALLHAESTLRHEASEELKKITGQFFGYYFNLPRRERERAHQRYVEWWQREGRVRFHDQAV